MQCLKAKQEPNKARLKLDLVMLGLHTSVSMTSCLASPLPSQHAGGVCKSSVGLLCAGLRRRLQGPAPAVAPGQASQHNYSAHMSVSMALGFLFMAGGRATFSTSPQATAALVIALFPRFPHSPTDHRCHLQVSPHGCVQTQRVNHNLG